jgi:hypothetical protein
MRSSEKSSLTLGIKIIRGLYGLLWWTALGRSRTFNRGKK